ncbi:Ty3/gypsy retrotransposon protein [Sesbania bispinosa]|nr:Ty3/gypsy retrotransposon protein [Sesbania bispinosa]
MAQTTLLDDIKHQVVASSKLQELIAQLRMDPSLKPHYFVRDGILYWKNRIVIPEDAGGLITQILQEFHSSSIGGHSGFLRTHARIAISSQYVPLPLLTSLEGLVIQPLEVVDVRKIKVRDEWLVQVLVRWDGSQPESWENLDFLQSKFPHFDLVDKVLFYGEGNVMIKGNVIERVEEHVASDPKGKDKTCEAVRRSNRVKRIPDRFRDI